MPRPVPENWKSYGPATAVGQTMTASSPEAAAFWTSRLARGFRPVVRAMRLLRVERQVLVHHPRFRDLQGVDGAGVNQAAHTGCSYGSDHVARSFQVDPLSLRVQAGGEADLCSQVINDVHSIHGAQERVYLQHIARNNLHI